MDSATLRELYTEYLVEGKIVTLSVASLTEFNTMKRKLFETKQAQSQEYNVAGFTEEENPYHNMMLRVSPWNPKDGSFTVQMLHSTLKKTTGPKQYKILSVSDPNYGDGN